MGLYPEHPATHQQVCFPLWRLVFEHVVPFPFAILRTRPAWRTCSVPKPCTMRAIFDCVPFRNVGECFYALLLAQAATSRAPPLSNVPCETDGYPSCTLSNAVYLRLHNPRQAEDDRAQQPRICVRRSRQVKENGRSACATFSACSPVIRSARILHVRTYRQV